MIAALYVQPGGIYYGLPDVDPWDEARDARLYDGPYPVVAHPPCARWSRLAGMVEARWGYRKGDDGGTFAAALAAVRKWGGVLEHPAYSDAWHTFGLPRPVLGAWEREMLGPGWVTEVCQNAYGHRARKRTWLYYVGAEPPALNWSEPEPQAWVGWADYDKYRVVERLPKSECSATPEPFRDLLLEMARSAR